MLDDSAEIKLDSIKISDIPSYKLRIFQEIQSYFPNAEYIDNRIELEGMAEGNRTFKKLHLVFDIPHVGNYVILYSHAGKTKICPHFPEGVSITDEINIAEVFEQYSHWLTPDKPKTFNPESELPPWMQ